MGTSNIWHLGDIIHMTSWWQHSYDILVTSYIWHLGDIIQYDILVTSYNMTSWWHRTIWHLGDITQYDILVTSYNMTSWWHHTIWHLGDIIHMTSSSHNTYQHGVIIRHVGELIQCRVFIIRICDGRFSTMRLAINPRPKWHLHTNVQPVDARPYHVHTHHCHSLNVWLLPVEYHVLVKTWPKVTFAILCQMQLILVDEKLTNQYLRYCHKSEYTQCHRISLYHSASTISHRVGSFAHAFYSWDKQHAQMSQLRQKTC